MLGRLFAFNIYYHIARWVHRIFINVQHLINIVSANVYFTHIAISFKGTLAGMVIHIMAHTTTVVYHRQQTVLLVPEHLAVFHHEEVLGCSTGMKVFNIPVGIIIEIQTAATAGIHAIFYSAWCMWVVTILIQVIGVIRI